MKHILVIHLGDGESIETVSFLGQELTIKRLGCHGDADQARAWITVHDGQVDAIGLEGLPAQLSLGGVSHPHSIGSSLSMAATATPVVDVQGMRETPDVRASDRQP